MNSGRILTQLFSVEPFKSLFDGEVAHEHRIEISPTSEHVIGSVHVVIGLSQPFLRWLGHDYRNFVALFLKSLPPLEPTFESDGLKAAVIVHAAKYSTGRPPM